MKREIKFRAWDKTENVMSYSDVEMFDDMVGFRFGHFGINVDTVDDIELMQFTGLKDKNGQEIYADDVISSVEYSYRVYVVPGGFSIKAPFWSKDTGDLNSGDELIMNPLGEPQNISWVKDHCEVIGNIYENPELLKQ